MIAATGRSSSGSRTRRLLLLVLALVTGAGLFVGGIWWVTSDEADTEFARRLHIHIEIMDNRPECDPEADFYGKPQPDCRAGFRFAEATAFDSSGAAIGSDTVEGSLGGVWAADIHTEPVDESEVTIEIPDCEPYSLRVRDEQETAVFNLRTDNTCGPLTPQN